MESIFILDNQNFEIALKLFTALFLGMSLGVERSIVGKTAGMRTYGLVAMGSALFVTIGILASGGYASSGIFTDSSARITAAIIQGIGFIGAGLIFLKETKVSGITTAAGIWVAAGVGAAIGYGFYFISIVTTILAIFAFTGLWVIENKVKAFVNLPEHHE